MEKKKASDSQITIRPTVCNNNKLSWGWMGENLPRSTKIWADKKTVGNSLGTGKVRESASTFSFVYQLKVAITGFFPY